MFERFTEAARRAVVLAQEEARLLKHNYIGTEHLLLGLIHEGEGVAARALEGLGVSLEMIRHEVEAVVKPGKDKPSGHIPFTPRAKKIMELSLREALQLNHNYIGTEHLLLGLIREGEGVGAQVLAKLGVGGSRARQAVIQLLSDESGEEGRPGQARATTAPPGAVIGVGFPAMRRGRAPAFVGVVAIGRQLQVEGGVRLVLLALEVWSGWFDLRFAALPAAGAKDIPPRAIHGLGDWDATDDAGTKYRCVGIAVGGQALLHVYQASFQPSPPPAARSLTLTVTTDSGDEVTITVPLDYASGDAAGDATAAD